MSTVTWCVGVLIFSVGKLYGEVFLISAKLVKIYDFLCLKYVIIGADKSIVVEEKSGFVNQMFWTCPGSHGALKIEDVRLILHEVTPAPFVFIEK